MYKKSKNSLIHISNEQHSKLLSYQIKDNENTAKYFDSK